VLYVVRRPQFLGFRKITLVEERVETFDECSLVLLLERFGHRALREDWSVFANRIFAIACKVPGYNVSPERRFVFDLSLSYFG